MMDARDAQGRVFDRETIGSVLRTILPTVIPSVAAYAPDASADERLQGLIERLRQKPGAAANGGVK